MFKVIIKLCTLIYPNIKKNNHIVSIFQLMQTIIKNNGLATFVKQWKQIKLHVTRYLTGNPLYTNKIGIGLDRDGWPKRISFLKELVNTNEGVRYVLTLMLISRVFKYERKDSPKVKIDSIINPSVRRKVYTIPNGFIKEFVKYFDLKEIDVSFDTTKSLYLSTKASINGKATLTALDSIKLLNQDQRDALLDLTDEKGKEYFYDILSLANSVNPMDYKVLKSKLNKTYIKESGKLSLIMDPDLKVRVIAIVDYFSQVMLKPIHTGILNNLKKFPCDRTFTQNPHHSWENNNHSFWSMDLSSATDRFPVSLQRRVLQHLIGVNRARSWQYLLTERDFHTPDGTTVRYAVGQPMGAYSSWAAFTLSHHLVVQFAAKLAGKFPFNQYIILGDDIVIKDDDVALKYKYLMERLGVELSDTKTHKSLFLYEFAKRWINKAKNVEWTGLPIVGIIDNIKNPIIVYTILFDYFFIKSNFYSFGRSLVVFIAEFYKDLKITSITLNPKTKKFVKNFEEINIKKRFLKTLKLFEFSLGHTFGLMNEDKIRLFIMHSIPNNSYVFKGEESLREIFNHGMMNLVNDNFQRIVKLSKGLLSSKMLPNLEDQQKLPLHISILNQINDLKLLLIDNLENRKSVFEIIKEINIIDFDKVFDGSRDKVATLMTVGKTFTRGFNHIRAFHNLLDEELNEDQIQYSLGYIQSNFMNDTIELNNLLINQLDYVREESLVYTKVKDQSEEKVELDSSQEHYPESKSEQNFILVDPEPEIQEFTEDERRLIESGKPWELVLLGDGKWVIKEIT